MSSRVQRKNLTLLVCPVLKADKVPSRTIQKIWRHPVNQSIKLIDGDKRKERYSIIKRMMAKSTLESKF